jgi:hypothetical protein
MINELKKPLDEIFKIIEKEIIKKVEEKSKGAPVTARLALDETMDVVSLPIALIATQTAVATLTAMDYDLREDDVKKEIQTIVEMFLFEAVRRAENFNIKCIPFQKLMEDEDDEWE